MPLFSGIQSLRLRSQSSNPSVDFALMTSAPYPGSNGFMDAFKHKPPPHSSHPDFANLTLLVFEAVMEVVCVSLPGYIVARMGMFDANNQKFVANLNTQLFTPCLSKSLVESARRLFPRVQSYRPIPPLAAIDPVRAGSPAPSSTPAMASYGNKMLTAYNSLHKARLAAERRQAGRTRRHPFHLRRPVDHILPDRLGRISHV
jgi:hypothetical protein